MVVVLGRKIARKIRSLTAAVEVRNLLQLAGCSANYIECLTLKSVAVGNYRQRERLHLKSGGHNKRAWD